MELVAVALARVVAFVDLVELDPKGRLHAPEFFAAAAKRFNFQKFPQKYEDFDFQKGLELGLGRWDKISIDKLMILPGGLTLDTRASTQDSEKLLREFVTWVASTNEFQYRPEMLRRKGYVSQLVFSTEVPILARMSDPVAKLSSRVSGELEKVIAEKISYETTGIGIGFDHLTRKLAPANFQIQRRIDVPFNQNRFFSEAPLPTDVHWRLLQAFEADVVTTQAVGA